MRVSEERIKTNHMLMDELDMWDELSVKSINDEWALRYYYMIMNLLNSQVDEAVKWLDSDEAKELFFEEASYQYGLFQSLENQWDSILDKKYVSIESLLGEVYRRGKAKGYAEMRQHIRFSDSDKLALNFVTGYNFGLISRIDNDTRNHIKNQIIGSIISGENPRNLAPKIMGTVGTRLQGSTFTPKQRAIMIARTEISRTQNTGILQSYINEGYTQVKILTSEDNNVCYLCLRNAYEFNEDEGVVFENRGEERIHNIIDLIDSNNFVPLHPNCRCTYLSIWKTKGEPPKYPMIICLNPGLRSSRKGSYTPYGQEVYFSKEKLTETLTGFIDTDDLDDFVELFFDFKKGVLDGSIEWCTGLTFEGYIEETYTYGLPNFVGLKQALIDAAEGKGIKILIHNHPFDSSLPSADDFFMFAKCKVKYGCSTNKLGTFVVKNNNMNLNEENAEDIKDLILEIEHKMDENFRKFDKNVDDYTEDEFNQKINTYIHNNKDKYIELYENAFNENKEFSVKFIDSKGD